MPVTHTRSEAVGDAPSAKRQKLEHVTPSSFDLASCFATGLLDEANVERLNSSYKSSEPYLHVVVDKLFQEDLLLGVKDECIEQLGFTEKETDIYKVHQTGDLASLSYLSEEQLKILSNLLKLRDALYSPMFRSFVRKVTGCGPLSGTKQDMSINSYKKGCHLLNHDDVIGTRRVSYILYMPLPHPEVWRPEWGGALELYPVKIGVDGIEEPLNVPSKIIPPSWNQFVFFEVQPGHSFHSVEEVVIDEGGCDRQRLSISGWFHKAQEGEDGYEGEEIEKQKSSLEQLTSTTTVTTPYPDIGDFINGTVEKDTFMPPKLSDEHIAFLSSFLNPSYLQMKTILSLSERFVEESSLQLHDFLNSSTSKSLERGLIECDKRDGLDEDTRRGRVPSHITGVSAEASETPWAITGPPHKARYCVLTSDPSPNSSTAMESLELLQNSSGSAEQILNILQNVLFKSTAFRSWLALVSKLFPLKYAVEARRFRPGLDYTLATSNDEQSILDVVLGLTPEAQETKARKVEEEKNAKGKGKAKAKKQEVDEEEEKPTGWEKGEWGGWECYMAPHDGDEDPAVYRSVHSKSKEEKSDDPSEGNGASASSDGRSNIEPKNMEVDDVELVRDVDDETDSNASSEDEDEDGTLLTVQPGFNRLLLVLRDEGVLRFVKYVSASAPGSRWDVCCEYEVYQEQESEGEVDENEDE